MLPKELQAAICCHYICIYMYLQIKFSMKIILLVIILHPFGCCFIQIIY